MQTRGVPPDIFGRRGIWNFFTVPDISGTLGGEAVKLKCTEYCAGTLQLWEGQRDEMGLQTCSEDC